ncbi:glycosyltransferase, partial [Chitinophaga sp.]|uniref:glycosyltransferase n=1 Tax=Chitinophaga sp. TaxID=1869181 RepID=UPI002634C898
ELKQAAVDTAAALGISDKVIFDNFRQDVPAVLQGIDIYCLPSLWEGFPIGVLEAMAMGKTVVATDVDGTREAVTHEENGWLIPPKNTAALAGAIAKMAADEPLRAKLSQAAIQMVQEKYNVSGMTRRIENVYTSLFSDKVQ